MSYNQRCGTPSIFHRQGIKWIKSRYGDALVVIRLTQRNYMDRIERAVTNGDVILMENIGETVDAVLEPLLGRVLIRKGRVLKVYHSFFWEYMTFYKIKKKSGKQ